MQYFVTIASTGGFGRAARTLHVSQSAISEQVRDLEEEVGAILIDRSQRQIRLTPQGEIFLTGARSTLLAAQRAIQAVKQSIQGQAGLLTIGFFVGGNGSFFPALIREFRRKYSEIQVSLVEMTPVMQVGALLRGDLDIGFTRPLPATSHEQLRSEHLYSEPLFAVLPKDHPAAQQREISISALQGERFVMVDRQSSLIVFDKIISLCTEAGFSPQIATTASVSSGVLALVEAGEGISIVAEGSRFLGSKEVSFVPLAGAAASVDLVIAWSADHSNPLVKSFLVSAREMKTKLRS